MFKSLGGITWLESPLLNSLPGIHQGTFLRHGGVSKGAFAELNVGYHVGDCIECVDENYRRIEPIIKGPVICPRQVHGSRICLVESVDQDVGECDGLVSYCSNFAMGALHADCQVAVFFDIEEKVIGIAHAGWRGLTLNLYAKMIAFMEKSCCVKRENLHVALSPSLGVGHAEFINWKEEFPPTFGRYEVQENYFDLKAFARDQLLQAGVKAKQLEISKICTYQESGDWFSYRREPKTGRHMTFVKLQG